MADNFLLKGFSGLAANYWWLATLEHFAVLVVLLLFWGNLKSKWRLAGRFISFYWVLTFGSVAYLFINTPGMTFVFFGILIALPTVFFGVELFSSSFDYTADNPNKINLAVGIVLIISGIWYPAYTESLLDAFLESPLGVLPAPTLLIALGMQFIVYPRTNKGLLWLLVLLGFFFGSTGVYRLHVYWDIILVLGAFYGLKILTDHKKPVQLDLALGP